MVWSLFCALCFVAVTSEATMTSSLGTATSIDEPLPVYLPAMPYTQLSVTPPSDPDCHGAQRFPYKFSIKVEFSVCSFFVFLGVLRICRRHKKLAYCLDILSSIYLLWATLTRSSYLHNTRVAQWTIDVCSAITSERGLIKDYLFVSIASWISSLFLELTSSVRFIKLFGDLLGGRHPGMRWSHCRKAVLLTACFCTLNSVFLTMILRGAVKKSVANVSDDTSVFIIQNLATFMRFTRQCIEGAIFIVGIATRAFRWQNSRSEVLFGSIAFSSFVLLIHSSVLMNAFSQQEAQFRGVEHYAVLVSLCTDVVFRFVVCAWALCNSRVGNIPRPYQPEDRRLPHSPHDLCTQCALLEDRHNIMTPTPHPMIQPFPAPPLDTPSPAPPPLPGEAVDYSDPVSVGEPLPLCRLETLPQQAIG